MNKFLIIFLIILYSFTPTFSQEIDYEQMYTELSADHDILLDEYDELLDDYDELKGKHIILDKEYEALSIDFANKNTAYDILNETYLAEIDYHLSTKLSLSSAKSTIIDLRDSLSDTLRMSDNKYMTLYPQMGYIGDEVTFGLGFSIRIPKLPIAFIMDADYIPTSDVPLNMQIGIGIRF